MGGTLNGAYPMVCFCDIPLSQIKEHIEKYGQYGIGLKKTWGIENGLNPVLYAEIKSHLSKEFASVMNHLFKGKDEQLLGLSEFEKSVIRIMSYVKNYQGELQRQNIMIPNYRFADEKEWRYVPLVEEDIPLAVDASKYLKNKTAANEKLCNMRLIFHPNDINYIIIKDDSEIENFINVLKNAKGNSYTYNDIERLTTRIITVDRIMEDF